MTQEYSHYGDHAGETICVIKCFKSVAQCTGANLDVIINSNALY